MKVGDVVMIYTDPITELNEEGRARLVHKSWENDLQEIWEVKFAGDSGTYYRTIKKD